MAHQHPSETKAPDPSEDRFSDAELRDLLTETLLLIDPHRDVAGRVDTAIRARRPKGA